MITDCQFDLSPMELYGDNVRALVARNPELAAKFYHKGLRLAISHQISSEHDQSCLEELKFEPDAKHLSSRALCLVITLLFLLSLKIELFQRVLIYISDLVCLKFLAISLINLFNQILCFDTPETIIY